MADRLIEIFVNARDSARVDEVLRDSDPVWVHTHTYPEQVIYRLLAGAKDVEGILDPLQAALHGNSDFRVLVMSVAATLPKVEEPEPVAPAENGKKKSTRISREELYQSLSGQTKLTKVYLVTVVLSTIVAAIGLARDNVAVVIGAMVIAPLLGPNVALALATTLGDLKLAAQALRTNAVGMALAAACAFAVGVLPGVETASIEISARTDVQWTDVLLALAAGAAGALAFTSGVPITVVGVMVAVALLPPLVSTVFLLIDGNLALAGGAAVLLATNVVCVNIAGIATFVAQGVRPRSWWEAEKSKRLARRALWVWGIALLVVVALVAVVQLRNANLAG